MNLCKIGLHNWETIEEREKIYLEEQIEAKLENRWEMDIVVRGCSLFTKFYVKKVCLNCHKIVDTITPMKNKIKIAINHKRIRQELAEKLMVGG